MSTYQSLTGETNTSLLNTCMTTCLYFVSAATNFGPYLLSNTTA